MKNTGDLGWLDGADEGEDSSSHARIRAALVRSGHADSPAPAERFLTRVEARAVSVTGRFLGICVMSDDDGNGRVVIPEDVLRGKGALISWLETNGYADVACDLPEDQERTYAAELRDRAAYATVTWHERDGLKEMPDGSLCASFGTVVFHVGADPQLTASRRQHQQRGTLTGWRAISCFALAHPMLLFCMGLAFSPAFAYWTRRYIAFELLGAVGSDDERVIAEVANSIHGHPSPALVLTDLRAGLSALGTAGDAGLVSLEDLLPEELLQLAQRCSADKHVLGLAPEVPDLPAVLVINGNWKSPANRLRQPKWRPAHEQVLPGLPASPLGNLTAGDEGQRAGLRQQIRDVIDQHSGHAYPALLRALVKLGAEAPRQFEEYRSTAAKKLREDAGGTVGIEGHVLDTFAILSASIAMAAVVGVIEAPEDASVRCFSTIFRRWQAAWRFRRGYDDVVLAAEVQRALRATNSACEQGAGRAERQKLGHRAPYGSEMVLWFTPEQFTELCGDNDPRACADALDHYGALLKQNKGYQFRKRFSVAAAPGGGKSRAGDLQSFYAIRASFLELAIR